MASHERWNAIDTGRAHAVPCFARAAFADLARSGRRVVRCRDTRGHAQAEERPDRARRDRLQRHLRQQEPGRARADVPMERLAFPGVADRPDRPRQSADAVCPRRDHCRDLSAGPQTRAGDRPRRGRDVDLPRPLPSGCNH